MTPKSTVASRGAAYFGWHDKPRTSIKVGPRECLIVGEAGGRTCLLYYSEEYHPKGEYISLTDKQVDDLRSALFFGGGAFGEAA